ncbi:MAG TPA: AAA family ATPase [Leptospiraceae bacterium]|nr:AAA family ATPase [Leptospiraceae bacterium]
MIEENRLESLLLEFKENSDLWFSGVKDIVKSYHEFFKNFLVKEKIKNYKWEDFQTIGNYLHSFNSMPLAKARALGEMNHTLEHYRISFKELVNIDLPVKERINKIVEKGEPRYLKYFGLSSISEIICHIEPDKYVFYNRRDRGAVEYLVGEIEEDPNEKKGDLFERYNKVIEPIIEEYKRILGGKSKTDTTIQMDVDQFFSWLYINKISKLEKENKKNKSVVLKDKAFSKEFPYLEKLEIKNFYTIKKLGLNDLSKSKEIYILGENGDGKTLLLQSIIISLYSQYAKTNKITEIEKMLSDDEELEITSTLTNGDVYKAYYQDIIDKDAPLSIPKHVIAYGVNRNKTSKEQYKTFGFLTLFNSDLMLRDPIDWLQWKKFNELEHKKEGISLGSATHLISSILGHGFKIKEVNSREVIFEERGNVTVYSELSDGFKSFITWILDLIYRLSESQPNVTDTKDFYGIVLVDEIDLFMHPKWQYRIVGRLREWFPKIQFIFTTHSPIVLLGSSSDAIFYRIYRDKAITYVGDIYSYEEIQDLMASSITTSPLFDLEYAGMKNNQGSVSTYDSFYESKIMKEVNQKIKEQRDQKPFPISKKTIQEIIAGAINKYGKGGDNDKDQ